MFLIQFSFPNNYAFIDKDNLYNEYTNKNMHSLKEKVRNMEKINNNGNLNIRLKNTIEMSICFRVAFYWKTQKKIVQHFKEYVLYTNLNPCP